MLCFWQNKKVSIGLLSLSIALVCSLPPVNCRIMQINSRARPPVARDTKRKSCMVSDSSRSTERIHLICGRLIYGDQYHAFCVEI